MYEDTYDWINGKNKLVNIIDMYDQISIVCKWYSIRLW